MSTNHSVKEISIPTENKSFGAGSSTHDIPSFFLMNGGTHERSEEHEVSFHGIRKGRFGCEFPFNTRSK
jgi:hypothetical protein